MLALRTLNSFERAFKQMRKRGKQGEKLWAIVDLLLQEQDLPMRCRPHKLKGQWAHSWECHIKPDWLLVYQYQDDELILVDTGTHSDLFG